MVTVLGSTNRSAHLTDLLAAQKTQAPVQKSAEEEFGNTYLDSILDKCSSQMSNVNSFNDFKKVFVGVAKADYYYAGDIADVQDFSNHKEKADYLSLNEDDSKKEFVKYCESRGCYSEKELQALNKTGLNTMQDLSKATVNTIKGFSSKLVEMGYKDCDLTDKEIEKIVSRATCDDMAYLNDSKKTKIEKIEYLQKFITRLISDEDISKYLGKEITDKLKNMPSALETLVEIMKEEAKKKRAAEKEQANVQSVDEETSQDTDANIEKYNASLIAMYAA